MSRPEKLINWEEVDEFLATGCMGTEIASYYDMHPNTFYKRVEDTYNMSFTEYSKQKKQIGDVLIRKAQFQKALGINKDGDNTMLIWLGKQRLGQTEKQEGQVNVAEELRKCLVETFGSKGISDLNSGRSPEQSLLDQRPTGQENKISNELGAT